MFDLSRRPAFEEVKRTVERLVRESKARYGGGQPSPDVADNAAKLRQLAELRNSGVISSEDFEAKKVELLARM